MVASLTCLRLIAPLNSLIRPKLKDSLRWMSLANTSRHTLDRLSTLISDFTGEGSSFKAESPSSVFTLAFLCAEYAGFLTD